MAARPAQYFGVRPPIHLLAREADILSDLALQAEQRHPVVAAMLLAEIERAELHDQDTLPADVVSLGSTVSYWDEGSNIRRTIKIVMPGLADSQLSRVSVLTPVGAGLIGLSVGHLIDWPDAEGRERRLKVVSVEQPPRFAMA